MDSSSSNNYALKSNESILKCHSIENEDSAVESDSSMDPSASEGESSMEEESSSESDFSGDESPSEFEESSQDEYSSESEESSVSDSSDVYFIDMVTIPITRDELHLINADKAYSTLFIRRPTDCICVRAPAPHGDYLWEVSLFPFNQVSYLSRGQRWRYAQVIFTRTLNKNDELFTEVINIMDKTYRYVANHPELQNGPRQNGMAINFREFRDENNVQRGVNSNFFWRRERGCIWVRAPAELGDLLLEMSLYNFEDVIGVRKDDRWRFAKMNLSHTINISDPVYNMLIPVIKSVYAKILEDPDKESRICESIDEVIL